MSVSIVTFHPPSHDILTNLIQNTPNTSSGKQRKILRFATARNRNRETEKQRKKIAPTRALKRIVIHPVCLHRPSIITLLIASHHRSATFPMKQRHLGRKKARISSRHPDIPKQQPVANSATANAPGYDFDKPREEVDFESFYPDLDTKQPLNVYIVKSASANIDGEISDVGESNDTDDFQNNNKNNNNNNEKYFSKTVHIAHSQKSSSASSPDSQTEFFDASEGHLSPATNQNATDHNDSTIVPHSVKDLISAQRGLSAREKKLLTENVNFSSSFKSYIKNMLDFCDEPEIKTAIPSNIIVKSKAELSASFRNISAKPVPTNFRKRLQDEIDQNDEYTIYNKKRKFLDIISQLQKNVNKQRGETTSSSTAPDLSQPFPSVESPATEPLQNETLDNNNKSQHVPSSSTTSIASLHSSASTPNSSVVDQNPEIAKVNSFRLFTSGIKEENCINRDQFLLSRVTPSLERLNPSYQSIRYPFYALQTVPKPSLDLILQTHPNLIYQKPMVTKSFFEKQPFDYSSNLQVVQLYMNRSDFRISNYEKLKTETPTEMESAELLAIQLSSANKEQSTKLSAAAEQIQKLNKYIDHELYLKKIEYFGFKQPRLNPQAKLSDTFIRENDFNCLESFQLDTYEEFAVSTKTDRKGFSMFRCLYDMDEQDDYFLSIINKKRIKNGLSFVSLEIFEIAMTFLEKEWFFLSKRIPKDDNSKEKLELDIKYQKAVEFASMYGCDDGIGMGPENDQPCAVCNDSECDNQNAIVFCDGCNIAVHQECYGVVFIPEGQWLCRRCMSLKRKRINCEFCPSITGAFKQTESGLWSHVLCGLWIPELSLKSNIYMETVDGIERVPKSRWKLICYICKKRHGACIQCANKNCFQAFHVTCAKRAGLYMKMHGGVQGVLQDKKNLTAFCDKHVPNDYVIDVKRGIEKTRAYFDMLLGNGSANGNTLRTVSPKYKTLGDGISYYEHSNMLKKKITKPVIAAVKALRDNNNNILRWQSKKGTPIAPQLFLDKLIKLLQFLYIDGEDETSRGKLAQDICKYWSLKREWKTGPLIKTIDTYNLSNVVSSRDAGDIIKMNNLMNNDIHKLIDVSEDIIKRQKLSLQSYAMDLQNLENANFSLQELIRPVITKLLSIDQTNDKLLSRYRPCIVTNNNIHDKGNNTNGRSSSSYSNVRERIYNVDILSLNQIVKKLTNFGYTKTLTDFINDIKLLFNNVKQTENIDNDVNIAKLQKLMQQEYIDKIYPLLDELKSLDYEVFRKNRGVGGYENAFADVFADKNGDCGGAKNGKGGKVEELVDAKPK